MLQIFYCKTCFNPHTEYLCHSYNGLCCTDCCPCADKVNGDGQVTLDNNGGIWNLTHQVASEIFTPVDIPEAQLEVNLEDIVNDPTSPNYIGGGL
jgi:hypothetical protein